MSERVRPAPKVYFEGFPFRPYNPTTAIVIVKEDGKIVDPFANLPERPVRRRVINKREQWTPDGIMGSFARTLRTVSRKTGEPFSMDGIEVQFVTPEDMRPKTDAERESLRERYGDYILDGGAGDCRRNKDGTFTIRLGVLGTTYTKTEVLELLAHEYGHTLGDNIDSPVDEELKAYAFANLFMKTYSHVVFYSNFGLTTETLHDTALYRLDQLVNRMEPEVVLAHLVDKPFAGHEPDAYQAYINN